VLAEKQSYNIADNVSRLRRLIRAARLPHALLFVGSNSAATGLCALQCAHAINCKISAGDALPENYTSKDSCCESCRLIKAGTHPDVPRIDCSAFDGDAIERLRALLATSYRKPFLGGARVTILENSNALSLAAQNLLLKTLEEPRANNYYILTTPTASQLPSTIISRSQVWFFADDLSNMPLLEQPQASELTAQLQRVAKGETHTAIALATRINKEFKDQILLVLSTFQNFGRSQVLSAQNTANTQRWARFINDLCELEYTIDTRNFNSQYQFAWALERLAAS